MAVVTPVIVAGPSLTELGNRIPLGQNGFDLTSIVANEDKGLENQCAGIELDHFSIRLFPCVRDGP
jgi:hypothetical protein